MNDRPWSAALRAPWLRWSVLAGGAALVLWCVLGDQFRYSDGSLSGTVVLPVAAGAALIIIGLASRPWLHASWWIGGTIVGQAAVLQLIDAGNQVGYQHLSVDWSERLDQVSVLALSLLTVAVVHARGRLLDQRVPRSWRLALVALGFVGTSAALSGRVGTYVLELVAASTLQALVLATAWMAAVTAPIPVSRSVPPTAAGPWDRVDRSPVRDPVVMGAAAASALLAALLAVLVYERHPHIPDEVIYLFHARYFAAGKLFLAPPPVPDAFDIKLTLLWQGHWLSPVPPGWPALLALGFLVGTPWLVNPVLTGVNVVLAAALAGRMFGPRTARLTALLLAVSPWAVFLGMSFMTHTATLTAALVGANGLVRMYRGGSWAWGLLAGGAAGFVSIIRPLEGLATAIILGVWALHLSARNRTLVPVLVLGLGALGVSALQLAYNAALMGDPLAFPIMTYTDVAYGPGLNALGFGPDRGLGWPGLDPLPGHGLADVVINALLNLFALNVELFGWASGSLWLCLGYLFFGRPSRADWAIVGSAAIVVGLHSFYWFSGGPDFGARYWYLTIIPLILITARAMERLAVQIGWPGVRLVVTSLVAASLLTFYPWRSVDKYYHYRDMRPDVRSLARERGFGRSIVFVRGRVHPDLGSAAVYNPIDLTADQPVYVLDRGAESRQRVLAAFEDRPAWVLDGPSVSGAGFRVVEGPLVGAARERLGRETSSGANREQSR